MNEQRKRKVGLEIVVYRARWCVISSNRAISKILHEVYRVVQKKMHGSRKMRISSCFSSFHLAVTRLSLCAAKEGETE